MFPSLRQSLAWVRARWHADLEFQHSGQQRALGERLDQLLAKLEAEACRLDQFEGRLTGLKTLVGATSQNVAASLATLEGAEPRLRSALTKVEQGLYDIHARLGDRIATVSAQSDNLTHSLGAQHEAVRQTLESLTGLREELQGERQRRLEWEARWEASQLQERAAAESRERRRDQELSEVAQREEPLLQACRAEQAAEAKREELAAEARRSQQAIKASRRKLTSKDRAAIENQGVFVVGSARSATTILCDCLNLSREVYLLQEAYFFCNDRTAQNVGWENHDFAATFNARHVWNGNLRDKGTFIPTAATPDRTPLEFLNRIRGKYRYLGEKVAFGPQPNESGENWENDFLDYQARHFYHSQYFITVRAPDEAVWSMHKLFPDRPIPVLFECWLRSLRVSLELYLAFPHTHLILSEWVDARTVRRVGDILRTEIPLPAGWVGRDYQTSAMDADMLVPVLQPYRDWCEECGELYNILRQEFHRESLRFESNGHPRDLVKLLRERATALLEIVMRPAQPRASAA